MMANRAQCCSIFGWSPREFDRNVALGLPAKKRTSSRGDTWSVDTAAAVSWIVAQAVGEQGDCAGPLDVNEQRARLLVHQANLAQLTEQERQGKSLLTAILVIVVLLDLIGGVLAVMISGASLLARAVRLALIRTHYRSVADFSDAAVAEAKRELDRLYRALERYPDLGTADVPSPVMAALCDDLNTPLAL